MSSYLAIPARVFLAFIFSMLTNGADTAPGSTKGIAAGPSVSLVKKIAAAAADLFFFSGAMQRAK